MAAGRQGSSCIRGHDFPLRERESLRAMPFQATVLARVVRERRDAEVATPRVARRPDGSSEKVLKVFA